MPAQKEYISSAVSMLVVVSWWDLHPIKISIIHGHFPWVTQPAAHHGLRLLTRVVLYVCPHSWCYLWCLAHLKPSRNNVNSLVCCACHWSQHSSSCSGSKVVKKYFICCLDLVSHLSSYDTPIKIQIINQSCLRMNDKIKNIVLGYVGQRQPTKDCFKIFQDQIRYKVR